MRTEVTGKDGRSKLPSSPGAYSRPHTKKKCTADSFMCHEKESHIDARPGPPQTSDLWNWADLVTSQRKLRGRMLVPWLSV